MTRNLILTLALTVGLGVAVSAQTPAPGAPPGPARTTVGPNFVDADGDGICDLYQQRAGSGQRMGRGYGPGNGTGNRGLGPRDGTGYGPGAASGNCDGTGPKGQRRGNGPRR
jgi:hypothetical protein